MNSLTVMINGKKRLSQSFDHYDFRFVLDLVMAMAKEFHDGTNILAYIITNGNVIVPLYDRRVR